MQIRTSRKNLLWITLSISILITLSYSTNKFLSNIKETLINQTKEKSVSYIKFLKTLRGYYTKNVISDVISSGALKVHFDHSDKGTIPLPATMIHNLSSLISKKENTETFNLYSKFPFPNRANRKLDNFQKEAITFLEKNPDEKYIKLTHTEDGTFLRVAISDKLVHASCVNCHNTHPLTPRKGWKLGDMRGVLEVKTSLNKTFFAFEEVTKHFLGIFIGSLLFLGALSFIYYRHNRKKAQLYLKKVKNEIEGKENEVNSLSQDLSNRGKNLVEISKDQNLNSKNASNSVEKFSTLVNQVIDVKDQFGKSYELVEEKLKGGRDSVEVMKHSINSLSDFSGKLLAIEEYLADINKKIQKANSIFEQTRLLSFNAAIEAAHAGKFGKGFSVVANEVSILAEDSDITFKEIFKMVNTSKSEINTILNSTRDLINASKSNSLNAINSFEEMDKELNQMAGKFKALEDVSKTIGSEFTAINSSIKELDKKMPEEHEIAKGIELISSQLNTISKEMIELVTKSEYLDKE